MTRSARRGPVGFAAIGAILAVACSTALVPSGSPPSTPAVASSVEPASTEPTEIASADGRLAGAWQATPVQLGDPQVAIVSDACAAAARQQLGEAEANLPTELVDARGGGSVTAIFADDLMAVVCLARFADNGATATVDSVARLTSAVMEPIDGGSVSVDAAIHPDDGAGGRTVAFGRVGPLASAVQLALDVDPPVSASVAKGRWAMWWPGTKPALAASAFDASGALVGSVDPPVGELEARVGPASWWIDPKAPALTAASTRVRALVLERACASGHSSAGRVEPPDIVATDTSITVTFRVRHRNGGQDCQGHPPSPFTIALPEPLGNRMLLDGSENPPRDATKAP